LTSPQVREGSRCAAVVMLSKPMSAADATDISAAADVRRLFALLGSCSPERAAFADGTPPAADAHAQKAAAAAAEKAGPAAPRAPRLPYIESWDVALSDSNLDIGQDGSSARRPNSDGCYPAGLATPPALKFTLSAEVR